MYSVCATVRDDLYYFELTDNVGEDILILPVVTHEDFVEITPTHPDGMGCLL